MINCAAVTATRTAPSTARPPNVDLSVQVGSLTLSNPIIAASGTFGYGVEFAHLVDLNTLGGIVVKGLSLEPMLGAPSPRLVPTASGMVNAVGLQNIGVRAFVRDKLPSLRRYRTAIIANVFGRTIQEYVEVVRILENAEGLAAYELNVSCPNVETGGSEFGNDPRTTEAVVAAVRQVAKRPLWVKLPPLVGSLAPIALAAEAGGANALTIANTYPALCIDVHTGQPRLGNVVGGLSGPAIKPLSLRLVWDASRVVRVPIIGSGGVETAEDTLEYLSVGAVAVQVGTAHFADPAASARILERVRSYWNSIKLSGIS